VGNVGRTVTVEFNQNRTSLSLTGFAPGIYFFILRGSSSGIMDKGKFLAEP